MGCRENTNFALDVTPHSSNIGLWAPHKEDKRVSGQGGTGGEDVKGTMCLKG